MTSDGPERPAPDPAPGFDPWQPFTPGSREAPPPPAAEPEPAAPRRPRPRTGVLLTAALLLGVLGGGAVGYAVQARRPPTPLPPLAVPWPAYPDRPLDAKAAAAAAVEPLKIDGDLRKLLISKPKGAKDWDFMPGVDGWMPIDEMALMWSNARGMFIKLLADDFRRAATVSWLEGDTDFRVRLIQFGPDGASQPAADVQLAACDDDTCTSRPIPGTATGVALVSNTTETYAESKDRYYLGLAVARRGNVEMRIDVHSPRKVDINRVLDLAQRQWERL
ncbi:hypothetical protein ACIQGZ_01815 [Streptomyces sp. NPDC092296]|uniref:hypothetical protein n=1 Tax=Streptomyces sp. NPDC092296 TaxID=3366012 RepID=UPI00382E3A5D